MNKTMNALVEAWNANVLGILGSPQGILIPDGTSYAGAVELTDTQVTNLFGILQSLQTTNFTSGNQAAFVLASWPEQHAVMTNGGQCDSHLAGTPIWL